MNVSRNAKILNCGNFSHPSLIERSQMEGNQVAEGVVIEVPANVGVPSMGAEMPVISKERWDGLRRMYAEGQSVSQIARMSGLDRSSCLRSVA
jgi:helix-turn-helix resolvase-like protein